MVPSVPLVLYVFPFLCKPQSRSSSTPESQLVPDLKSTRVGSHLSSSLTRCCRSVCHRAPLFFQFLGVYRSIEGDLYPRSPSHTSTISSGPEASGKAAGSWCMRPAVLRAEDSLTGACFLVQLLPIYIMVSVCARPYFILIRFPFPRAGT